MRAALNSPLDPNGNRPLTANQNEYVRITADRRRRLLGALGEALIADGQRGAGLDTLSLAVTDGWDLELLKRVASQQLQTGDTAGLLRVEARITVDPRTLPAHIDSVTRLAISRVGSANWAIARNNARREMVRETMNRSLLRSIRGDPNGIDSAGRALSLKAMTAGQPSVIVYWSRHCGPALASLSAIDSVGRVLRRQGVPVYLIADESPSPDIANFFRERQVVVPVLYDSRKEISRGLGNFGTPAYYVLDGGGRIRFNHVREVNDLLLQIEAIRSSDVSTTSQALSSRRSH